MKENSALKFKDGKKMSVFFLAEMKEEKKKFMWCVGIVVRMIVFL